MALSLNMRAPTITAVVLDDPITVWIAVTMLSIYRWGYNLGLRIAV
jgi:hypothetical protein